MILLCKFNFISAAAKERFLRFRTLPTTIHNLNKEGLQETIVNRTLLRRAFIAFAKAVWTAFGSSFALWLFGRRPEKFISVIYLTCYNLFT